MRRRKSDDAEMQNDENIAKQIFSFSSFEQIFVVAMVRRRKKETLNSGDGKIARIKTREKRIIKNGESKKLKHEAKKESEPRETN